MELAVEDLALTSEAEDNEAKLRELALSMGPAAFNAACWNLQSDQEVSV